MNFIILESIWVTVSGEGFSISEGEKSLSMVDMMVQRKTNGSDNQIGLSFDIPGWRSKKG